jgi:hypothetical protein
MQISAFLISAHAALSKRNPGNNFKEPPSRIVRTHECSRVYVTRVYDTTYKWAATIATSHKWFDSTSIFLFAAATLDLLPTSVWSLQKVVGR